MRQFGYLKDIPSDQDLQARHLLYGLALLPSPSTFKYVTDPIVLDQGDTSECVPHSGCGCRADERQWANQTFVNFDPHTFYDCIKQPGGGAYPKDCADLMLHRGMPVYGKKPHCLAKRTSSGWDGQYKLGGYWRISKDMPDDEIKQILMVYGSFMAASEWDDRWMDKFSVFPAPAGRSDGGHCYRVIGWDITGWIVVNSWGKILWGDGGIATMPYGMFRQYVLSEGDCWKLQDNLTANKVLRRLMVPNSLGTCYSGQ
jgi:hypothetical protein